MILWNLLKIREFFKSLKFIIPICFVLAFLSTRLIIVPDTYFMQIHLTATKRSSPLAKGSVIWLAWPNFTEIQKRKILFQRSNGWDLKKGIFRSIGNQPAELEIKGLFKREDNLIFFRSQYSGQAIVEINGKAKVIDLYDSTPTMTALPLRDFAVKKTVSRNFSLSLFGRRFVLLLLVSVVFRICLRFVYKKQPESSDFQKLLLATPHVISVVLVGKLLYFSFLLPEEFWNHGSLIAPGTRHLGSFNWTTVNSTFALLLILWSFIFLFRKELAFAGALFFNFFLSLVCLVQLLYARFYGDVISLSISNFSGGHMIQDVLPSIYSVLDWTILLCFADVFIGVLIFPLYKKLCQKTGVKPISRLAPVALLILGLMFSISTVGFLLSTDQIARKVGLKMVVASMVGIPSYQFYDAVSFLLVKEENLTSSDLKKVKDFIQIQDHNSGHSNLFGIARGKNLILINTESLQNFPIGLKIHQQEVTPRISRFIKESLYFSNFYHQAHLGTTSDAEFVALQSLHPPAAGLFVETYRKNHFRALPLILREHGFNTISACGASGSFWYMSEMHSKYGFQHSYYDNDFDMTEKIGPWLSDYQFFKQTVQKLKSQRQPYMAFLLTSSNHHPFELPQKYRSLNLGNLEGTMLGKYLHSVHYYDSAFGQFLDQLSENGLLENTIIAMYGDHDAFLSLENLQSIGFYANTELGRLEFKKKVPFIIRLPRGERAANYEQAGAEIDISPTLLSLLGIHEEHTVMLGQDLTKSTNSFVVFRDGSYINNRCFYIFNWGLDKASCFDHLNRMPIDCREVEYDHQRAMEQLQMSDYILKGDLIPRLTK